MIEQPRQVRLQVRKQKRLPLSRKTAVRGHVKLVAVDCMGDRVRRLKQTKNRRLQAGEAKQPAEFCYYIPVELAQSLRLSRLAQNLKKLLTKVP